MELHTHPLRFAPLAAAAEGALVILPGKRENLPWRRQYSLQGTLQLSLKISNSSVSLNDVSRSILLHA